MKTPLTICLLVLTMMVQAFAQQSASPCEQEQPKFAAVVMAPVVGTCQLRDTEKAQPQPVKPGQAIRSGQALKCNSGARLKIQFCKSKAEKEIAQNAPNWYVVPNVPSLRQPSGLVAMMRTSYNWECPPDAISRSPCIFIIYLPDAVAKKEVELWSLYQKKEAKLLEEAMSNDFYAIYPDGQRVSKQRFLQDMFKINLKDFLWSDVYEAPVGDRRKFSYVVFAHLVKDGQERSILMEVTSSWILRNGKWYIVAHEQKSI